MRGRPRLYSSCGEPVRNFKFFVIILPHGEKMEDDEEGELGVWRHIQRQHLLVGQLHHWNFTFCRTEFTGDDCSKKAHRMLMSQTLCIAAGLIKMEENLMLSTEYVKRVFPKLREWSGEMFRHTAIGHCGVKSLQAILVTRETLFWRTQCVTLCDQWGLGTVGSVISQAYYYRHDRAKLPPSGKHLHLLMLVHT